MCYINHNKFTMDQKNKADYLYINYKFVNNNGHLKLQINDPNDEQRKKDIIMGIKDFFR